MTNEELLQLIAQAEKEGWEELNLEYEDLTALPPEIGRLTNLTALGLNNNQLTTLPPEIGCLINLTLLDLSNNQLTALPPEIGNLAKLIALDLGSSIISRTQNQLTALPPEIGRLTNLSVLDLSFNPLAALPPEIFHLTNLAWLDLRGNQQAILPPEIGRLTNLAWLDLSYRQLAVLPPEIGRLTNLERLYLSGNQLTALPPEIVRLINLTRLDLDRNRLTSLPPEIGRLAKLSWFDLKGNQLAALPPEIGHLTNLSVLDLSDNQLVALPPEIFRLAELRCLDLSGNRLTTLPPEIEYLTKLDALCLNGNQLTTLPPEIGRFTWLARLEINSNQLTALPPEIGRLTGLAVLDLSDNQLTQLPAELGNLRYPEASLLSLSNNPWSEPYATLIKESPKELLSYLHGLLHGVPQYEAKALLVGEGAVGKTCLLAALRDEEFLVDRPTTHGIEIKQVSAPHPGLFVREQLTLNFWDFGGQEVYRITHQFFFSRHALYLLVWKPREGREENALEGWLERIRLRVGGDARVLIVATHCNERQPELDYPALQSKYGDILAGHCAVDSADGTSIPELRQRIAQIVAEMEHVGTVNQRWLDVRDELLGLDQTHVTYAEFAEVCAKHGLDETDTSALIRMLHTLGYIIFYDSDGLRDFVVLKPEWLTKAIGYVLEDRATRQQGGILDHHRLGAIWHEHGDEQRESYPPRYFPYFLRLMEQYEVSARLEGQQASLIPQMLPYERPALPWEADAPGEQAHLALVCAMDQNPPGLVAWTTVRNHRWTTDLHWRNGVFLRHEDGHEALVDFVSRLKHELHLTARGEYPAHFMSLLRDGLERLIEERWPHLVYELYVPCPRRENGRACPGRFKLRTLYKARALNKKTRECDECLADVPISQLLEGYVVSIEPLSQQLAEMEARMLAQFTAGNQLILAQLAEMTRRVLRAFLDEARNGPRLFTLSPVDSAKSWAPRNLLREELQLTLWCEHPGHEHELAGDEGCYHIPNPRKWVTKIAPYALLAVKLLRIAAPLAAGAVGMAGQPFQDKHKATFDFMEKLSKSAAEVKPDLQEAAHRIDHLKYPYSRAEGAGLHAFHKLLADVGWKPGAANLRRVTDKTSGDVLWVCATHYKEYDPGLPVLPGVGKWEVGS